MSSSAAVERSQLVRIRIQIDGSELTDYNAGRSGGFSDAHGFDGLFAFGGRTYSHAGFRRVCGHPDLPTRV